MILKDGALLIEKPEGITSFGALHEIKRAIGDALKIKRSRDLPKIGHAGTLDPFATGLLVVLLGEATKLSDWFLGSEKEYVATARFGEKTASGDRTNEITERTNAIPTSIEELRKTAVDFVGRPYDQIPPMFSAKKVDGRALYELARQGKEIERETKRVLIREFEVEAWDPPLARFRAVVSAGTYIRVLAEDWAKKMGSLAHLASLKRTRSGRFLLENSLPLDQVTERIRKKEDLSGALGFLGLAELLSIFSPIQVSNEEAALLRNGRKDIAIAVLARLQDSEARDPGGPGYAAAACFAGTEPIALLRATPPFGIVRVFLSDRDHTLQSVRL